MVPAIESLKAQCHGEVRLPHGMILGCILSPSDAVELLAHNSPGQRGLRVTTVYAFRRAMEEGRYPCVTPIVVTASGLVIDGQHRLYALAGASADTRLAISLFIVSVEHEHDVRRTIDNGTSRNAADMVRVCTSGEMRLQTSVSSAIAIDLTNGGSSGSHSYTRADVAARAMAEPFLPELMSLARAHSRMTRGPTLAAVLRCLRVDSAAAQSFWGGVLAERPEIKGVYSETANSLIRWLTSERTGSTKEVMAKCILAWNAWRRGEERKLLRWTAGTIPEPV